MRIILICACLAAALPGPARAQGEALKVQQAFNAVEDAARPARILTTRPSPAACP
jgi:hypothetical protein